MGPRLFLAGEESRKCLREQVSVYKKAAADGPLSAAARLQSVMEQPNAGKRHDHIVFIADGDDVIISKRPAGLRYVLHAALMSALDVVAKGEECIGTQRHSCHRVKPCPLLFLCKDIRLDFEYLLPLTFCQYIHILVSDIEIDGVIADRPLDLVHKGQFQNLGSLAQIPVIRFVARQPRAMHPRLLARSNPDGLSALGVTYGYAKSPLISEEKMTWS